MPARLPSLNGLLAFEAAARHLSLARAAAELGVTKSAISHQIRKLEARLAVRLFHRNAPALVLTPEGQDYARGIAPAFASLRVATADISRVRPRDGGILTVSTTPTLAAKWLVPRLSGFRASHPEIDVRISTSMRLVDFAREGVDLAIRSGTGEWPGLRTDRLLLTDAFFPVCSPLLLRDNQTLFSPADLAATTLLGVDYELDEWRSWLTVALVPARVVADLARRMLIFDVSYMALQAAIEGVGVALGYGPYVEADLAAGRLVAPFDIRLPSSAGFDDYVVCPEATAETVDISVFREWLLTVPPLRPTPSPER